MLTKHEAAWRRFTLSERVALDGTYAAAVGKYELGRASRAGREEWILFLGPDGWDVGAPSVSPEIARVRREPGNDCGRNCPKGDKYPEEVLAASPWLACQSASSK